jgi:hypothetical protein
MSLPRFQSNFLELLARFRGYKAKQFFGRMQSQALGAGCKAMQAVERMESQAAKPSIERLQNISC